MLLLIRFLDLYEREPIAVLCLMAVWGTTGAAVLSIVGNQFVAQLLDPEVEAVFGAAIEAPIVEESAKGLALVAAFVASGWLSRKFGTFGFEGVTDGIVYGAAIGVGFAFTEDFIYLLNVAAEEGLGAGIHVFLLRRDFFGPGGFGHAIYTGAFGAGLGMATWSPRLIGRMLWPLLGFFVAVLLHAQHNGLMQLVLTARYGFDNTVAIMTTGEVEADLAARMVQTAESVNALYPWIQWALLLCLLGAMYLWVRYQRSVIRYELQDEVGTGVILREELDLIPSYWRRTAWYWQIIRTGYVEQSHLIRRIHSELVDLAFLKWRIRRRGGDTGLIERRRERIRRLRAFAPTAV